MRDISDQLLEWFMLGEVETSILVDSEDDVLKQVELIDSILPPFYNRLVGNESFKERIHRNDPARNCMVIPHENLTSNPYRSESFYICRHVERISDTSGIPTVCIVVKHEASEKELSEYSDGLVKIKNGRIFSIFDLHNRELMTTKVAGKDITLHFNHTARVDIRASLTREQCELFDKFTKKHWGTIK